MQERVKGTIRFSFKDSIAMLERNKSKESLILLYFSYGKNRFKYSTGYKVTFSDWDFKKQRVKNKTSVLNKDKINEDISDLENFIDKYIYTEEFLSSSFNPKAFKHQLDIVLKKAIAHKSNKLSFHEVFENYTKLKKGNISIITIRSYKQTISKLKAYEEHYNTVLDFKDIDMTFYYQFNSFMEEKKYSLNTIGKHIKNLKTLMRYAFTEGYVSNPVFTNSEFKVKKEITTEIYLTDAEIEQMLNKDLSKHPEHSLSRDVFLMGCYTGQRISDYNGLKEEDIIIKDGIRYFKILQKKNKRYQRTVFCPITKEMDLIMNTRHDGKPPKEIPEPILNEKIKEVGQLLEWDELIKCQHTKGGKHINEKIEKSELIKSHTARRSFCTNKYKAGMPIFDIMLFSGHTTEKEFYKYIRIKDEERAAHIAKSGFFNV